MHSQQFDFYKTSTKCYYAKGFVYPMTVVDAFDASGTYRDSFYKVGINDVSWLLLEDPPFKAQT